MIGTSCGERRIVRRHVRILSRSPSRMKRQLAIRRRFFCAAGWLEPGSFVGYSSMPSPGRELGGIVRQRPNWRPDRFVYNNLGCDLDFGSRWSSDRLPSGRGVLRNLPIRLRP